MFCDQKTAGGGWTVFQKRQDGSVDFFLGWTDYKIGFGNLNGEFWLGLDKINRLTNSAKFRLRVDLEDTKGKTLKERQRMPRTITLLSPVRKQSTSSVLELTQVSLSIQLMNLRDYSSLTEWMNSLRIFIVCQIYLRNCWRFFKSESWIPLFNQRSGQ